MEKEETDVQQAEQTVQIKACQKIWERYLLEGRMVKLPDTSEIMKGEEARLAHAHAQSLSCV